MSECFKVNYGGLSISIKSEAYNKIKPLEGVEEFPKKIKILTECARKELVDVLNKRGDVENIHSLFNRDELEYSYDYVSFLEDNGVRYTFAPILFTLKLPITLQNLITPVTQKTERFNVLIDGLIMMIFTECDLGKIPTGLPAVRDRIVEIIDESELLKSSIFPPNIAHGEIAIVKGMNVTSNRKYEVIVSVNDTSNIDNHIKYIYQLLRSDLYSFFIANQIKESIYKTKNQLNEIESALIDVLSKHVILNWWNMIKKHEYIRQLEDKSINALKILAKYSSNTRNLENYHSEIKEETIDKQLLKKLYDAGFWKSHLSYEEYSIDSFLRIFNQVQKNIELHKNTQASVMSGLIGGLIGSFLTYLLSMTV